MSIEVELVPSPTEEARLLITELEAELSAIYSAEQRHGLSVERVFQPNVLFFIARQDGQAAGCGGVAFAEDFAEVKRMYVRPKSRGRKIAQAILNRLEREARARGATRLVLETGDTQVAAIALYQKAGFKPCAAFGDYSRMPPQAVRRSRFFEKSLR